MDRNRVPKCGICCLQIPRGPLSAVPLVTLFLSLFWGDILRCSSLRDSQKLHRSSWSLNLSATCVLLSHSSPINHLLCIFSNPFIFIYIYTDILHIFIYFSPSCSSSFSHYKTYSGGFINLTSTLSNPTHRIPWELNEREIFWNENTHYDDRHPISSLVKPDAKRICY